ncbi:MAG: NAD(P)/FAD-dependent oxidoreductase [Candidatus Helarchaeota archaeon]|nr:NAD(P)/FAD-dependent oxidoreductase [Candidatus Helarchaeota archaeon]
MASKILIIGAGAAGLFAAYELCQLENVEIVVIEEGPAVDQRNCASKEHAVCMKCDPCRMLCGVGGAGTYSSGLLNLDPKIGGDLAELAGNEEKARELIERIDSIFVKHGAPNQLFYPSEEKITEIQRLAGSVGIRFIPVRQRLIGTENAPEIIKNIQNYLEKNGVQLILNQRVVEILPNQVVLHNGNIVDYNYCLAAPGRSGMHWLAEQMEKLNIETKYLPVDIGVRVEVPSFIMDHICNFERDPKFHIYATTYDDFVRSFCTNHQGYVVQEMYDDGTVAVNGHSFITEQSKNTNFALLVRVSLTHPLEDTSEYGKRIVQACTTLGGGKPLVQRLGDVKRGRRSNEERIKKNIVQPTLKSTTAGDISMAFPHRIHTDILEAIERLDTVIPGIESDSTLLYAPEIKYSAKLVITNEHLETSIENLFVAGDGAGKTRGIIGAAVSGMVAAQGIKSKLA